MDENAKEWRAHLISIIEKNHEVVLDKLEEAKKQVVTDVAMIRKDVDGVKDEFKAFKWKTIKYGGVIAACIIFGKDKVMGFFKHFI